MVSYFIFIFFNIQNRPGQSTAPTPPTFNLHSGRSVGVVSLSGTPSRQQDRDTRSHWWPTDSVWSQGRPCSWAAFPRRQQSQHIYRTRNATSEEKKNNPQKQQHLLLLQCLGEHDTDLETRNKKVTERCVSAAEPTVWQTVEQQWRRQTDKHWMTSFPYGWCHQSWEQPSYVSQGRVMTVKRVRKLVFHLQEFVSLTYYFVCVPKSDDCSLI